MSKSDRWFKTRMNKIAQLSQELDEAAKERFGKDAHVFVSDDESISIMTGYSNETKFGSQAEFIAIEADEYHTLNIGS